MAKPRDQRGDDAGGDAPASPSVSLKAVATKLADEKDLDTAQRAREIGLPSAEADGVTPPAPAAKKTDDAPKPFNYDEWFGAQPEEAKNTFASNVVSHYAAAIKQTVGEDVYELAAEIAKDPALAKQVGRLKDPEMRKFLFDTAIAIYEDPQYVPRESQATATDPRYDKLERELADIKSANASESQIKAQQTYESTRRSELEALVREFPELRFDAAKADSSEYLRVADIIDRAERKSLADGKVISYRDVYESTKKAWSSSAGPPRSIPSTSAAGAPPARQAPKTETESRARMRDTLEKYGGLKGLANAIKR